MSRISPNIAAMRWLALLLVVATCWPRAAASQSLAYPVADRDGVIDDLHGTRIADPYRWLEQLDPPRTGAWLRAERGLTARYFRALRDREAIRRKLASLWIYPRTDVPWREAGRLFFVRNT